MVLSFSCYLKSEVCNTSRVQLSKDLNVLESSTSNGLPLLSEVVKRAGGERVTCIRNNSTEVFLIMHFTT